MKISVFGIFALILTGSISLASDGPNHHICQGIYAHKANDGSWKLWDKDDKWTAPGHMTVKNFLDQYCHDKPHAKIHEKRG